MLLCIRVLRKLEFRVMNRTARIIAALALVALIAGCGARGPLEPPPGADPNPPPEPFVLDPVI